MFKYFTDSSNTESEYAYPVGRIRQLENTLLAKDTLDKMIEAKDLHSCFNIFLDSGFRTDKTEMIDPENFEEFLEQELYLTYKIIKDIAPYPFIYDMFAINYDFHNIKVLLKSRFAKKRYSKILSRIGILDINNLNKAIEEDRFNEIPIFFELAIKKVISEYTKIPDPEIIDLILDKEKFTLMEELIKDRKIPFLEEFIKINIDLVNLIAAVRLKIREEDKNYLRKVLIDKGNISIKSFQDVFDSPLSSWITKFLKTNYEKIVEIGLKTYETQSSLLEIERLKDNFILDYVKIGKNITFGVEPLIGFIVAKENDIKNIRIILTGKINNWPAIRIKERIRDAYV